VRCDVKFVACIVRSIDLVVYTMQIVSKQFHISHHEINGQILFY